jgi:hypothetical protein
MALRGTAERISRRTISQNAPPMHTNHTAMCPPSIIGRWP